ncbi:MAG: dTDP-4-dehydrorhamnose 3,5-epimerase family protein [Nocardioidaceae bacterium]
MDIRELSIRGAFEVRPAVHGDERGTFVEWFRAEQFEAATGHPFTFAQANCSVSAVGALRGVHFAKLPPSQAKYVTCTHGSVYDVVVDIRVGSPTYGKWEGVELRGGARNAVYLGEGLGHAFMALADGSVVTYLCSAPYAPDREFGVNPLDEALGIAWPTTDVIGAPLEPLLSPKDLAAPTLEEAAALGLLPDYDEVLSFVSGLGD